MLCFNYYFVNNFTCGNIKIVYQVFQEGKLFLCFFGDMEVGAHVKDNIFYFLTYDF